MSSKTHEAVAPARAAGSSKAWSGTLPFVVAGLLASAWLAASLPRPHVTSSATSSPGMPAVPDSRRATAEASPRSASASAAREIEALVDTVAGKYRVPRRTLRHLVRTAHREGTRIGVDPLLVIAVMAVESGFDPLAQSPAGALGPMQVIPRFHADKFDAARGESILDPATNIQVGVKVLKEYIARDGNQMAGLQRYNGAANDPHKAYAKKVLREKHWLKQAIRRPDVRA